MENTTNWILVIVAVIVLFFIAIYAIVLLFSGSVVLLAWASSQGFIGVAIYFALWIFAFPFMLIASIITGLVSEWALTKEKRKEKQIQAWRNKNLSNQSAKQTTPSDPEERRKWANRLPPYDQ
jgi:membrane protein implicated in regulation of membrane protease activity